MTESEAIKLIEEINLDTDKVQKWADLGCGSGLFSYALACLLPQDSIITSIDKVNHSPFKSVDTEVKIEFIQADFIEEDLPLSDLNGILMANSFHYVKAKEMFLEKLKSYLSENGRLVIIEYDTGKTNPWIPYPIPCSDLKRLISELGFTDFRKIGERPSRSGNKNMYAAEMKLY